MTHKETGLWLSQKAKEQAKENLKFWDFTKNEELKDVLEVINKWDINKKELKEKFDSNHELKEDFWKLHKTRLREQTFKWLKISDIEKSLNNRSDSKKQLYINYCNENISEFKKTLKQYVIETLEGATDFSKVTYNLNYLIDLGIKINNQDNTKEINKIFQNDTEIDEIIEKINNRASILKKLSHIENINDQKLIDFISSDSIIHKEITNFINEIQKEFFYKNALNTGLLKEDYKKTFENWELAGIDIKQTIDNLSKIKISKENTDSFHYKLSENFKRESKKWLKNELI